FAAALAERELPPQRGASQGKRKQKQCEHAQGENEPLGETHALQAPARDLFQKLEGGKRDLCDTPPAEEVNDDRQRRRHHPGQKRSVQKRKRHINRTVCAFPDTGGGLRRRAFQWTSARTRCGSPYTPVHTRATTP